MIRALEGFAPEWYTPPGQDDSEPVTRFRIRPLDGAEYGEVADYVEIDDGQVMILSSGRNLCLQRGLLDWEHFSDSNGPVKFSQANARLIPHEYRMQLVARILTISNLDRDQEKNS